MARKKIAQISEAVEETPAVVAVEEKQPEQEQPVIEENVVEQEQPAVDVPVVPQEETMPEQEAPKTPLPSVASVIALQKQLNEQREAAIQQLLAQQVEIAAQLDLLGYQAEPAPFSRPAQRRTSAPTTPKPAGAGEGPFCKICNVSGHDMRAHRGQAVKKAFSKAELDALAGK